MKLRTAPTIVAAFLLALLLLVGAGGSAYWNMLRLIDDGARVDHTREVVTEIEKLAKTVALDATGRHAYLITGDQALLEQHPKAHTKIRNSVATIHDLVADNPPQQRRLKTLAALWDQWDLLTEKQIELRRNAGLEAVQSDLTTAAAGQLLARIAETVAEMTGEEDRLLDIRRKRNTASATFARKAVVWSSLLAVTLVGLALGQLARERQERKRADELIRGSERFRAAILDAIPAEIAVLDSHGTITAVNEPWTRFGRENLAACGPTAGVGSDYLKTTRCGGSAKSLFASQAAAGIAAILNGESKEFRLEYPCDSATEERWFLMHAVAVPAEIGGVIVSHSNISQLKLAEQALAAHEELLRTLIEAIPDTVQLKDSNGRWMVANAAALRHFQLGSVEWAGKSDEELAAFAPPEIAASLVKCHSSEETIWRRTEALRTMDRVPQADGMTRFFDVIKVPLRHRNGLPRLLLVIGRDITAQKQAEEALHERKEELETIMREVPVAIFIGKGADSRHITGNPAARQLMQAGPDPTRSANMPWSGFRIYHNGREVTASELPMQRAAATGIAVLGIEFEVIFDNAESVRVIGNGVPLFDATGKVRGSVGSFIDITQQKAAEEALRDFNSQLEARVKQRTDVLETAMDDLRDEVAERQRLEEEILQIGERQQMRIGQDLHDDLGQQLVGIAILAGILSRELEAEANPKAHEAEQLSAYITAAISATRNLAKSFYPVELERAGLLPALHDLAQRTELLSTASCTLSGDDDFAVEKAAEIHLYRIVQESISNAIRHGHASRIEIQCRKRDDRQTLTITDNGSGFTPPKAGQQSGMGLHLFHYRARLIGASIDVRRMDPGGCQVTCSLPG